MTDLNTAQKGINFREILFVTALATKPLYLTHSGTMQISDFIYMALLGSFLLREKITFPGIKEKQWIISFFWLIVYQFAVNIISFVACKLQGYSDIAIITRVIYYIFNLLVCLTVFQMYSLVGYERLLKLYLLGSALSVLVCYVGVALNWRGTGRVTGFFNNPNQLGYYAILSMTVFVIYCHDLNKLIRLVLIISCVVLNVWSLSKASLLGSAALLISYALISGEGKNSKKTIIAVVAVVIVATLLYLVMYSDSKIFSDNYYIIKMRGRIINMGEESDSDLGTGRGYDRIKEIGLMIITGVGQGAYTRFNALSGKELHSTYASILVSYGLIGFIWYGSLFAKAIFSNKKYLFNILAMSGVLLYSITHNGIRSSLLWTLITMLLLRPYSTKKRYL